MKYQRIIQYVSETPWAIMPSKLMEILSVLSFRAAGGEFTPEEIRARIGDGGATMSPRQGGAVGVVPIRGVIAHRMSSMEQSSGGTSAEGIAQMLRQAMADPNISTVVLDVDSPGGSVTGMQELAAELYEMRGRGTKRIVAVSNAMMGSAAYWLASQADEIVGMPSSLTGSIGVFTVHHDLSKAMEQDGIAVKVLSAGKYKTEQLPFGPLSAEAQAFIQGRVDEAYGQFVKDVARGRGVTPAAVRGGFGEGRALGAKDAKAAGLIDRIATMDETLARLVGRQSAGRMRAESETPDLAALDPSVAEPVLVGAPVDARERFLL